MKQEAAMYRYFPFHLFPVLYVFNHTGKYLDYVFFTMFHQNFYLNKILNQIRLTSLRDDLNSKQFLSPDLQVGNWKRIQRVSV